MNYTYQEIHELCKSLASDLGQKYDLIIAIGSGGFIPARILKTYLQLDIYTITVQSYYSQDQREIVKKQWLDDPNKINGKHVLLIDEVDDTRRTLEYCVRELSKHSPKSITVGVVVNKKKLKKGCINVDYYSATEIDDQWILFPWDKL